MSGGSGGSEGGGGGDEAMVLDRCLRELRESWAVTGDAWRDQARSDFEREHLEPIDWRARHAMRSLSELAALCSEALRRCE